MGANIGTTITAQIVAFKITDVAPLILFAGVLIMMFVKKRSVRRIGEIVGGLGILFFGMNIMSEALAPLRDYEPFLNLLSTFEQPWIGLLAGLAVTAVIQSSSATMGIVQAFAMQNVLGLDTAVYIILGLNIGTCVTAILASLSGTKTAKRTALALLFLFHRSMFFMLLLQFLPIVDWVNSWFLMTRAPVAKLPHFLQRGYHRYIFGFPGCRQLATFFIRGEDKKWRGAS
jgi:phosphate:Na+ symporter